MGSSSRGFVSWGLVGLSIVALAGCGGGGGGGSDSNGDGGPEPATQVRAGTFLTEISYPSGKSFDGIAFLSPNGQFVSIVTRTIYSDGELSFDGASGVSGPAKDVVFDDSAGVNEWVVNRGTLEGTVNNSESMVLLGEGERNFQSRIKFSRESSYSNLDIRLSDMDGVYTMTGSNIDDIELTLDSDGTIHGSDATGCDFAGTLRIPDPRLNVYEVNFTASTCGKSIRGVEGTKRDGSYTGVGSFNPADGMGVLEFGSSDGEVALVFTGRR